MRKRKIVVLLMTLVMAGTVFTGCGGNESSTSDKKSEGQTQTSAIPIPEGEKMSKELMAEFTEANDMAKLCEQYGNIQINTSYVVMDENGKKSNGGKDSTVYALGENGVVSGSSGEDYASYSIGNQLSYSQYTYEGQTESIVSYLSESLCEEFGDMGTIGLYMANEYANANIYKETEDGYEIYEVYDWGDGTGNVITYYANKDKVVTKSESMCYPGNAARYIDSTRELKTGVQDGPKPIEYFENGEFTVTIVEKSSGNQKEIKVPAGAEISFGVNMTEAATLDEAGTEFVGGDRYNCMLTVNENTTVYIVEVGEDTSYMEDSYMEEGDAVPVG